MFDDTSFLQRFTSPAKRFRSGAAKCCRFQGYHLQPEASKKTPSFQWPKGQTEPGEALDRTLLVGQVFSCLKGNIFWQTTKTFKFIQLQAEKVLLGFMKYDLRTPRLVLRQYKRNYERSILSSKPLSVDPIFLPGWSRRKWLTKGLLKSPAHELHRRQCTWSVINTSVFVHW